MNAFLVRSILIGILEAFFAALIMSSIFLIYLEFLQRVFPSATKLTEMYNPVTLISNNTLRSQDQLFLKSGRDLFAFGKSHHLIATLAEKRKHVKHKEAKGFAWRDARLKMPLYDRDAVQTLSGASAVIAFDTHNTIDMGENALVIIKKIEEDKILREKRSTVLMLSGNLQGSMASSLGRYYTEISSPGGVTKIKTSKSQKRADYRIAVNSSQSSTVSMYRGQAEVIHEGKKMALLPNYSVKMVTNEPLKKPVRLPDPVSPLSPQNNRTYYFNKKKPSVTFKWKPSDLSTGYHFILANDKMFRSIILEKLINKPSYTYRYIPAGTFYWKVSARNATHQGAFSEARVLKVIRDKTPPQVSAKFPQDRTIAALYLITGKVQGATELFINSKPVKFNQRGFFEHEISLKPGVNVIVIEAIDRAGNINYQSKIVKRI